MSRPFIPAGFAALTTLTLAAWLGREIPPALAWACGGAGIFALFLLLVLKTKLSEAVPPGAFSVVFAVAAALLAAGASLFLYGKAFKQLSIPAERLDGGECEIRGVVLDYPEKAYHKTYYRIRVERVWESGSLIELPEFTVRISAWQPLECDPGDTVECEVGFYAFDGERGPYSVKSSRWADGIAIGGYLSGGGARVIPGTAWSLQELAAKGRHWAARMFEKSLPKREAGMIRAILLGEGSQAPEDAVDSFRKIGVSHLLAVSGLHLSSLAAFLAMLLKRLGVTGRANHVLCMAGVLFFLALLWFPVSALRSGIMLLLYLLAKCLGSRSDSLNSLGFALLVICLLQPMSGGDVGLALSALSTLGILLWAGPIQKALLGRFQKRPKLKRAFSPLAASLGVTVSALLATFPIQAAVFGGVSLVAPLANLLLVFPCTLLLYGSATAALFGCLPWTGLGAPFLFFAGWIARLVLWIADGLSRLPAAYLSLTSVSLLLPICLSAALAAAAAFLGKEKVFRVFSAGIAVLLFCCGWALDGPGKEGGTVTVATSEGSSCVLLIQGDKAAILSLGGAQTGSAAGLLSRYNIRRIDALCMPVRDADAREGAVRILEAYPVDRLVLPALAYAGQDLVLAGKRSQRVPVEDGDSFQVLDGVQITSSEDMARLNFSVNGLSVAVETGESGKGDCQLLFTNQTASQVNSAFTVLIGDGIIEEKDSLAGEELLEGLPEGCYVLPGGNGFCVDLLPGGSVNLRGDSVCLRSGKEN